MLQKLVFIFLVSFFCIASAQIYECRDHKGARLWTNEPCADGKVLHLGVDPAEQRRAYQADRDQAAQRARRDAAAAERFRQNAYSNGYASGGYRGAPSSKNLELCDTARRSLRIEYSKILAHRNHEKLRQLRIDEHKYC